MAEMIQSEPNETGSSFLIAGLGNPGREYRHSRHNIGFMLVDHLANRLNLSFSRVESKALVTKGVYQGQRLVLAKPQSFMNLSGQSVGSLVRFYKIPLENLLIVYDDVDLPLGTLRLRPAGGSGGHKGMASIIERLSTESIPRLRIGIGRPPGRMEAADYVLQDFTKNETQMVLQTLDRAADAVQVYISAGITASMNQFNPRQED